MGKYLNLSTDPTLGGNNPSDIKAPSQKAIKTYIDNQGMNIKMLEKYGITHIYPSTYDTKPDPHCFSYRRDGKTTGEHFTFAYIKKQE